MVNDLLLLSGIDIPFPQAQINIHQPTIKEISFIGEEAFFTGCQMLTFSKDVLSEKDRINLKNKTDFEVLMSILRDKRLAIQKNKINTLMLLTLIFPDYKVSFSKNSITLEKEEMICNIDNKNFDSFKENVISMFCLKRDNYQGLNYNPGNEAARQIAEKLKKGREKASQSKGETTKISILSRYVSILAVGQKKDINSLLNYTVYQLFDEFERFELKQNYDIYVKAKLSGAKDLEDVDNWTKDIHIY